MIPRRLGGKFGANAAEMKEAPYRSNGSGPRRLEQEKVPSQEPKLSERIACEIRATRA
jgi:hypothetical protein